MRGKLKEAQGLGTYLRERRAKRRWSMRRAGERCGLSVSAISRIESGSRTNLPMSTLVKLADGYGVSIRTLVVRSDGQAPQGALPT